LARSGGSVAALTTSGVIQIRFLALLIGLVLSQPLYALTIKADLNFDGSWSTLYRAGDKPIGGGDTCLSGYTCAAFGTATCQFDDQSATAINITATSQGETYGICAVYKTFAAETNRRVEFRLTGITGNQGTYAGGGAFISDDDADFTTPDYKSYVWLPVAGTMRHKSNAGGAGQSGQNGVLSTVAPRYGSFEYNATTNSMLGWESTDNWTTDLQIGTAVTHTFSAGRYGVFCGGYSTISSSTCSFTTIGDSTTLSNSAGDPDPDPTSDTPDYVDPVSGVSRAGGVITTNCNSTATCQTAITSAACNTDIVFAAGNYAAMTVNKTCAATVPIRLVGNGATKTTDITGVWTVTGARTIITGFDLSATGSQIKLGGTNNKIIGNYFAGWTVSYAIEHSGGGLQNEVAYNEFGTHGAYGPYNAGETQLRMGMRTNENSSGSNMPYAAWIHHNYFHDSPEKLLHNGEPNAYASSQNDAIEWCQSNVGAYVIAVGSGTPPTNTYTYIERNLFQRLLQTSGIVDMKCAAVFRLNTFEGVTNGRSDFRGPNFHGVIESNWYEGSGGMTIHGNTGRIVGNHSTGAGRITILAGTKACSTQDIQGVDHSLACNTLVVGNDFPLTVGLVQSGATLAATGTVIRAHDATPSDPAGIGTITYGLETGSTKTPAAAAGINFIPATKLIGHTWSMPNGQGTITSSSPDVSPTALTNASAAYKAARGF
jgi:hypothetical protein